METKYKPGALVTWTSQSSGVTKTKTGIVHAVMEPGESPASKLDIPQPKVSCDKTGFKWNKGSKSWRYLVAVLVSSPKGNVTNTIWYSPLTTVVDSK